MHRGRPAGGLDLLLRGVRLGDAQILLNGFIKQVGRLADHRYIFQKLVGADAVNIHAAKFDFTTVFLPEPQQQFEKGRFSAAGFADYADDLSLLGVHRDILQNLTVGIVGEGKAVYSEAFKSCLSAVGYGCYRRLFRQKVQHTITRGKGLGQVAGQGGDGNDRSEGTKHADNANDHAPG